jgi:hypothetical protein
MAMVACGVRCDFARTLTKPVHDIARRDDLPLAVGRAGTPGRGWLAELKTEMEAKSRQRRSCSAALGTESPRGWMLRPILMEELRSGYTMGGSSTTADSVGAGR